jgi:hypothetical protein
VGGSTWNWNVSFRHTWEIYRLSNYQLYNINLVSSKKNAGECRKNQAGWHNTNATRNCAPAGLRSDERLTQQSEKWSLLHGAMLLVRTITVRSPHVVAVNYILVISVHRLSWGLGERGAISEGAIYEFTLYRWSWYVFSNNGKIGCFKTLSVELVTSYELESPGIGTRWGQNFPQLSRLGLGFHQPSAQWVPGLSRVKEASSTAMVTESVE